MNKKTIAVIIAFSMILLYSCAHRSNKNTKTPDPSAENKAPSPASQSDTSLSAPEGTMNTLTPKEKTAGWQLLFDGTTYKGWHNYGSETIGTAWKIANGTLYLDHGKKDGGDQEKGGDILTDKEYENFELQLDWKIDTAGNSGVCFNINENKSKYKWMWYTGPEIQIVDNEKHPDGKIIKHQAGDLYDLISAQSHAEHPPLEWNHYRIRCLNRKLEIYLNDVLVVTTQIGDGNWKALVAGSKFNKLPDFATYKKGRIGLQDHESRVWFRNIKILEL